MPVPFPPRLASFYPLPFQASHLSDSSNERRPNATGKNEFAIDMEFDAAWETTSDWNEDDDEAIQEENALCFLESTSLAKDTLKSGSPHEAMIS